MKTQTSKSTFILIIIIILMISGCKKEPSYIGPLQVNTDKAIYQINDPIIVEVKNLTDSIAVHSWSNLFNFLPVIYKYENSSWTGYWAQLCNEYNCFCCKELLPGSSKKDTLLMNFDKGIYRIEYNFTMKPDNKNKIYYSNIFMVE